MYLNNVSQTALKVNRFDVVGTSEPRQDQTPQISVNVKGRELNPLLNLPLYK